MSDVLPPRVWARWFEAQDPLASWYDQKGHLERHYHGVSLYYVPNSMGDWVSRHSMVLKQLKNDMSEQIPYDHWLCLGGKFYFYTEEEAVMFKLMVNT